MKTLVKIILFLILLPLVAIAKPLDKAELNILPVKERTYHDDISYYSALYNVDSNLIYSIIQCESGGKDIYGDNGHAFGVAQYHKETFKRHSKKLGEELDYYSSEDQIKLLSFAISKGMGREWTAYRAIQNGGTYSFYSKLLDKHYTVSCKLSTYFNK